VKNVVKFTMFMTTTEMDAKGMFVMKNIAGNAGITMIQKEGVTSNL